MTPCFGTGEACLEAVSHGNFHSVSKEYLQKYLEEFAVRFNMLWIERTVFASTGKGGRGARSLADKLGEVDYCTHATP